MFAIWSKQSALLMPSKPAAFWNRWIGFWREHQAGQRTGASRGDGVEAGPTYVDAHLVMNCLNQTAAYFHSRTGLEDPRLFALADYLRLIFRSSAEASIPMEDEWAMLQAYVQLVETNRGISLPLEFAPGDQEDLHRAVLVQRHLSCDVLGAFLKALPGDALAQAEPQLRFEGSTSQWDYTLRAVMRPSDIARTEQRLHAEFEALLRRLGPSPAPMILQELTHSQNALTWAVHVSRQEGRP